MARARPTHNLLAIQACAVALALLLQALILPLGVVNAASHSCAPRPEQTCCDHACCCCCDPDICLCVVECPNGPLVPTRDEDPARPSDPRSEFATLARLNPVATPMPFSPRDGAVTTSSPRPPSAARTQALLNIWLT